MNAYRGISYAQHFPFVVKLFFPAHWVRCLLDKFVDQSFSTGELQPCLIVWWRMWEKLYKMLTIKCHYHAMLLLKVVSSKVHDNPAEKNS